MAERDPEKAAPQSGHAAALTDAEYQELLEMALQQGTLANRKRKSSCKSSASTSARRAT
jgi:hypothetical protein